MSLSPKRGSSRFSPPSSRPSLTPPSRIAAPSTGTVLVTGNLGHGRNLGLGASTSTGAGAGAGAGASVRSASAPVQSTNTPTPPGRSRSRTRPDPSSERGREKEDVSGLQTYTPKTVGGHAFRTVSAGSFRHNNPFAQRLQLAFMASTPPAAAGTASASASALGPGTVGAGTATETGKLVSSSPIYDRERTIPDKLDRSERSDRPDKPGNMPHTPPLHIVKSSTPKGQGQGHSQAQVGDDKSKVSGIPQPYTSRFGSSSLFTPPPSGHSTTTSACVDSPLTGSGSPRVGGSAKMVSPTLEIPVPHSRMAQKQDRHVTGSPASRSQGVSGIPSPSAGLGMARKSRFMGQARSPEGDTGEHPQMQVSGLPNPSPTALSLGGKKKAGVQRKTVPTLSPDTTHSSTLPRARSPGGASSGGPTSRIATSNDKGRGSNPGQGQSPSTLSPPSFYHGKAGKPILQPSVPVLRGGGGSASATVQGRRRSSSACSLSTNPHNPHSTQSQGKGQHATGLAPALPIVGRKDKSVEVTRSNVSPTHASAKVDRTDSTKQSTNEGGKGMMRSRSKSHVGHGSPVSIGRQADSPVRTMECRATACEHGRHPCQDQTTRVAGSYEPPHLGVPEHIRSRLRTLHQLSKVLGFDQAEIAREIDIPGLLGRVDRAVEKHKDLLCHYDERAEHRSRETIDAFAKADAVHPHSHSRFMPGTPSVQAMADALKHDWSAELRRAGGAEGVGAEETILGSPLELLPADAPFDVWPSCKGKLAGQGGKIDEPCAALTASRGMSRSASQRSVLDLDMAGESRFGASPSLSFATFGLGLGVAEWGDLERAQDEGAGSPLLHYDPAKGDEGCSEQKKGDKRKDWRAGMLSRLKTLGRKSVEGTAGKTRMGSGVQSESEDDEDFWEGQTDRKRKAATIGVWNVPAFGLALVDIPLDAWTGTRLDDEAHHVPLAAWLCVTELWERGMTSPGLFRLAGTEDQVERMYTTLNTPPFYGLGTDLSTSTPYSIAHSLKRFLRDLPEPILDESLLLPIWTWRAQSMSMRPAHSRRVSAAALLLRLLSPQHLSLFCYIMAFIAHMQCTPENRLTLDALAVVFGPAMLAPRSEGVPGVGAGTKGEKSDPVRVAMLVDQSQKCLAWLVRYWPLIRFGLGDGPVQMPVGSPVRGKKEVEETQEPKSPGSPRRGVAERERERETELAPPVPLKAPETRGNQSLDIPRPALAGSVHSNKLGKSGLSSSLSLSSFGLATSPSLSKGFRLDQVSEKSKATRVSSPLSLSTDILPLGNVERKSKIKEEESGKLKPSASSASGLGGLGGGRLRSALSNMNLSASFKDDEGPGGGLKLPKRSASFNNLSAVLKKGMGLGKSDKDKRDKVKAGLSTPSTPSDSPLLLTPAGSPDLALSLRPSGSVAALPRTSLSCDGGRPSSLFSTHSAANSQVSSVLGSLQDLLSSKDRQIERDARELAVLRHTLLEMNSKLSALSHAMPASPARSGSGCTCGQACSSSGASSVRGAGAGEMERKQVSPIITITQSPSAQLEDADVDAEVQGQDSQGEGAAGGDSLLADLRAQLDNALAALAVSRETTLTKDKQLVSIHQTLARHRAERLSETNKLESQLLIEVAKSKGLREERDLAKVRLEKVKHELFKVM